MGAERKRQNVPVRSVMTARQVRDQLGDVIDRAAYFNEVITVTRHGKELVEIRRVQKSGDAA